MSRIRVFLISGFVAVAGLAAASSSASAQASSNTNASCIGVLSSFVGADPFAVTLGVDKSRPDRAGADDLDVPPGGSVHQAAQLKSTLPSDPEVIPGLGNATLSCALQTGLP